MAESRDFSDSEFDNKGPSPNETIKLLNHAAIREWEAILQKAEQFEVDKGTSPKHRFEVRRNQGAPSDQAKIIYWGRDGWTNGYTHGEIIADRLTSSAVTVYAQRSDDDEAMKLTRLNRKMDTFINDAINNIDSKDRLGEDHE